MLEKEQDLTVGVVKVKQLMRSMGLTGKSKKGFKPQTTHRPDHSEEIARLYQTEGGKLTHDDPVWGTDMSYFKVKGRPDKYFYLVVVICLFSRKIKGWTLADNMRSEHTNQAIIQAIGNCENSLEGLCIHSDQGVQNQSQEVSATIKSMKIVQSMSRKGNCYDNAIVESFFHSMKNELGGVMPSHLEAAKQLIFEYIEWYNRERIHSSLNYLTPIEYGALHSK